MADSENAMGVSKKRVAGRQLSREADPDAGDEDVYGQETGSFQRASEEVLAARRIVKVRRTQQPTSSGAPNPFAAIQLVPSSGPHSGGVSKVTEAVGSTEATEKTKDEKEDLESGSTCSKSTEANIREPNKKEHNDDEPEKEESNSLIEEAGSRKTSEKIENPEQELESISADIRSTGTNAEEPNKEELRKDESDNDNELVDSTRAVENIEHAEEEVRSLSADLKSTEANTEEPNKEEHYEDEPEKKQLNKDEQGKGNIKSEKASSERKLPAAVKTFQQLSSAQNAFTGIVGSGFSSSCFSFDTKIMPFGSTPKFGSFSTGSAFGATTSFGSLSGTGSLFGTKPCLDDSPLSNTSGNTNNGAAPVQLIGAPTTGNNSTSGSGFGALQEVPLETGEENEKVVFTADAALFQYINGGWKERGKGELRLNTPIACTGRARLVMRAKGNYRLILNTNLYPDMKLTSMDKRGVTFACFNSAGEAKEGLATFALKLKDSSIVDDFRTAIEAHKGRSLAELKVPEDSPKTCEDPQSVATANEC